MGKPVPLDFAPGIVKTDAPYALRGRYIDCDKVRFVKGKPEKWKGWQNFAGPVLGIVRALFAWDDFGDTRWLAVGTHLGLFLANVAGALQKITPFRSTGTLAANPFAMTNGSPFVTVTHVGHGLTVIGTYVNFSGAAAAGGITVNGEYQVNTVVDNDHYTIIHSSNASSTTTGGGAAVAYSYEIDPGDQDVVQGLGWGTGPWGIGTWGTPRSSSNFTIYASMWSLDKYGENLLAMFSGNHLYQWDPDTPSLRAALVANSPTGNFMFVTNERYPVVLGSNGDNMALAWPDQNDITNWTASSTSTANERRLQKGSRLIAGANLAQTSNVIWTDDAAYSMNYTGQRNAVYNTLLAAEKCGLIGPHGFATAAGRAYWMSHRDFFMYGGGTVQKIPNSEDIRDWLYARLDGQQNWKVSCRFLSEHNEIAWFYVLDGDREPRYYVAVSLDDWSWTFGGLSRGAWAEKSGISPAVYASDENSIIFLHEVGHDADGAAMPWFLESAPIDIDDGGLNFDIWGYLPNFYRQTGDVAVTFTTWDMPQHTIAQEVANDTISEGEGMIDLHASGRQSSVRLSGNALGGDFRLGLARVEISEAGQRRGAA